MPESWRISARTSARTSRVLHPDARADSGARGGRAVVVTRGAPRRALARLLNDGGEEAVDPATFRVGAGDVPYCAVKAAPSRLDCRAPPLSALGARRVRRGVGRGGALRVGGRGVPAGARLVMQVAALLMKILRAAGPRLSLRQPRHDRAAVPRRARRLGHRVHRRPQEATAVAQPTGTRRRADASAS